MKINRTYIRSDDNANENFVYSGGTAFYQVTADDALEALSQSGGNKFSMQAFKDNGWDAVNIDDMYGSRIINDVLYICQTDGEEIVVGSALVDPEEALDEFDLDELAEYIHRTTPRVILQFLSPYDIIIDDVDNLALELLESGESFKTLVDNYEAFEFD